MEWHNESENAVESKPTTISCGPKVPTGIAMVVAGTIKLK